MASPPVLCACGLRTGGCGVFSIVPCGVAVVVMGMLEEIEAVFLKSAPELGLGLGLERAMMCLLLSLGSGGLFLWLL